MQLVHAAFMLTCHMSCQVEGPDTAHHLHTTLAITATSDREHD